MTLVPPMSHAIGITTLAPRVISRKKREERNQQEGSKKLPIVKFQDENHVIVPVVCYSSV